MGHRYRIESLLSAKLFLNPRLVDGRLYFISDLSGRLSLHAMDTGAISCLLPKDVALPTPLLVGGESYHVYPRLGRALVMIDRNGDENLQPCFVPLEGGTPEPVFGSRFAGQKVALTHSDSKANLAYFSVDPRTNPTYSSYRADLAARTLEELGGSLYGNLVAGAAEDHSAVLLVDSYTAGDHVAYVGRRGSTGRTRLFGKPIEDRKPGEKVRPCLVGHGVFVDGNRGVVVVTSQFEDTYGLGYLELDRPDQMDRVEVVGTAHSGVGELKSIESAGGDRVTLQYNIDGCSWAYEGSYDRVARRVTVDRVLAGSNSLRHGVLQSLARDEASGTYAAAFSTATTPVQVYTIDTAGAVQRNTNQGFDGVPEELLSPGEDASFASHDGLRVSARLYLPAPGLGFQGKRPVVFYLHGGPQGQERPDFTWFSMPLIQWLTLHGIAVFAPNARGSTGYGLSYMKRVDHDWGGLDRLDHVEAHRRLSGDARLDLGRAGVMGRSYGGYMTLTLAGRHPELWKAACDMFGPYDLLTFMERIPETWKTYFHLAVGHPERDRAFLVERSPKTHLGALACPMLVIQGRNDPRVREAESADLVRDLKARGKEIEYRVFEDEGHDVTRFENKVACYTELVEFFVRHLRP